MKSSKMTTKYIALIAMFTAVSYVLVLISKIIPNVAGFLSYEPKDAMIVIAGFMLGPLASFFVSILTSLIEMLTISSTGPYGLLMNVVSTCAFALPAAFIYQKKHSRNGAVFGLIAGVIVMVGCMLIWNYTVTPLYMGVERSVVAGMLASVFLPFNLVKGGINAVIALLIYKPLVSSLRKAGLVENSKTAEGEKNKASGKRISIGHLIVLIVVLITLVLLLLSLAGVIK